MLGYSRRKLKLTIARGQIGRVRPTVAAADRNEHRDAPVSHMLHPLLKFRIILF